MSNDELFDAVTQCALEAGAPDMNADVIQGFVRRIAQEGPAVDAERRVAMFALSDALQVATQAGQPRGSKVAEVLRDPGLNIKPETRKEMVLGLTSAAGPGKAAALLTKLPS